MSEASSAPGPLPRSILADTSFLRTLGGPDRERYQAVIEHLRASGRTLFLTPGVSEELEEQAGYVSGDWLTLADTASWVERTGPVQYGVRVHDGPRAGEVTDWAHERLSTLEQTDPDDLRPTDANLAGAAVMLLGSRPPETVGVVLDDRNAEAALTTALENTFYERRIRVLDIWTVVEHAERSTMCDTDGRQ